MAQVSSKLHEKLWSDAAYKRVVIASIVNVHGIKGLLKVRIFTEDPSTFFYLPLVDENGTPFSFKKMPNYAPHDGIHIVQCVGITNREKAEKTKGKELYADRIHLPKVPRGTYYHVDMIGLVVITREAAVLGTVKAVHNFGAGDLLEVLLKRNNSTDFFHFSTTVVSVDLKRGVIVIDPPTYI